MQVVGSVLYSRDSATDSASSSDWLYMEQAEYDTFKNTASFADLGDMFTRAKGGLSARSYRKSGCSVSFTEETGVDEEGNNIIIAQLTLPFYVYVPSEDFVYTLEPNNPDQSVISDDFELGLVSKAGTFVVPLTDSLDMQARITDVDITANNPVYNGIGEEVGFPGWTVNEETPNIINFGTEIFTVLFIRYRAMAHKYVLTLTITRQEGYAVQNIKPVVVASWQSNGETQSKTLEFTVPECVYNSLETCPEDETGPPSFYIINPTHTVSIYYSSCHGGFLGARVDEEE